ncbi:hypothetical protein M7I_0597 [Glarea lozoyensis 74030]|uniref:Uncharacterized protein n=1 Tax=Glarea lozoyensis (strain ATCC 74030 / MF5533) TaxID=1104152 RepID=H0EDY6_GLAL7|nr:hypothetical protein M7I_0597 [Glarea lozoyensis 74030]
MAKCFCLIFQPENLSTKLAWFIQLVVAIVPALAWPEPDSLRTAQSNSNSVCYGQDRNCDLNDAINLYNYLVNDGNGGISVDLGTVLKRSNSCYVYVSGRMVARMMEITLDQFSNPSFFTSSLILGKLPMICFTFTAIIIPHSSNPILHLTSFA